MGSAKETGGVVGVLTTLALLYALAALTGALLDRASEDWHWTSAQQSLFAASAKGDVAGVDRALIRGASLEAHGAQGLTALSVAARHGHVDVACKLIAAETNPELSQPLICAARNERVQVVEMLLRAGADTEERDMVGCTALWYAAANGNDAIARMLLDAGARTGECGIDGRAPLEVALDRENREVAELLRAKKKPMP